MDLCVQSNIYAELMTHLRDILFMPLKTYAYICEYNMYILVNKSTYVYRKQGDSEEKYLR